MLWPRGQCLSLRRGTKEEYLCSSKMYRASIGLMLGVEEWALHAEALQCSCSRGVVGGGSSGASSHDGAEMQGSARSGDRL